MMNPKAADVIIWVLLGVFVPVGAFYIAARLVGVL
jgi:hypothetical protein